MQEASHFELGEQLPAVPAITVWRADRADTAGAERKPSGVSARGAGRVPTAEENRSRGRGGPFQHPAHGGQGTVMESRQRTGLNRSVAMSEKTDSDQRGPDTGVNAYTVLEGMLKQAVVLLQCAASEVGYQEPVPAW